MAFTVQDDNGTVSGANSYLSVADFKAYHDDRGNDYSAYSDANIQTALVRSTDYLDQRFRFVGTRTNDRTTQTTEWPRSDAIDNDGRLTFGIPDAVKEATAEYALVALAQALNPTPTRDATGARVASKAASVGPISESMSYFAGGTFVMPSYPAADYRLRASGLVANGARVRRA